MPLIIPIGTTHAAAIVIRFRDGGPPEETLFCLGSKEQCEEAARLTNACSYGGDRPVDTAEVVIVPYSPKETS